MKYLYLCVLIIICVFINAKQIYMDIVLKNSKIGWLSLSMDTINNNIMQKEMSKMKLNVYDNNIEVIGQNFALYDMNMKLIKFFISIVSKQMYFYSNGYVENDTLYVKTQLGSDIYEEKFYIKDKKIIFNIEAINTQDMDNVYMFNPLSNRLDLLQIELKQESGKMIIGTPEIEYEVYMKNSDIEKIVSEEGISMIKTDSLKENIEFISILNLFEIKAQGNFSDIKKADKAVYIIHNASNLNWDNYRQKTKGDTLIVYKKPLFIPEQLKSEISIYTRPNKELMDIAKALKLQYKSDNELLQAIIDYINDNFAQTIVSGLQSIEQIMKNRQGDCTEFAQIFMALANACGYEADIVSGIVYKDGKFFYHAWNRVLTNGKIYTIDAVFSQLNADVGHIQISSGYPPSKILISELGKNIKIERLK